MKEKKVKDAKFQEVLNINGTEVTVNRATAKLIDREVTKAKKRKEFDAMTEDEQKAFKKKRLLKRVGIGAAVGATVLGGILAIGCKGSGDTDEDVPFEDGQETADDNDYPTDDSPVVDEE